MSTTEDKQPNSLCNALERNDANREGGVTHSPGTLASSRLHGEVRQIQGGDALLGATNPSSKLNLQGLSLSVALPLSAGKGQTTGVGGGGELCFRAPRKASRSSQTH